MSTLNAIGEPSLGEILTKRLNTPGGAVAPGVAPEIFPCLVLESDRPEWKYLGGEGIYARSGVLGAGGAGTLSAIRLVNPRADSLLVVERISLTVASGNAVVRLAHLGIGFLPFGSQSNGTTRDTRARTTAAALRSSSAVIVADNTLGASTNPIMDLNALSLTSTDPLVIGAGGMVELCPDGLNVAINRYTIVWRERGLNPGERI